MYTTGAEKLRRIVCVTTKARGDRHAWNQRQLRGCTERRATSTYQGMGQQGCCMCPLSYGERVWQVVEKASTSV
jgi:hypothetical protein